MFEKIREAELATGTVAHLGRLETGTVSRYETNSECVKWTLCQYFARSLHFAAASGLGAPETVR